MKLLSSILCVIILAASTITVSADTLLAEFKIRLVDKDGTVLENALVTMYPATNPQDDEYRYLTTDANGEFRVTDMRSGNCTILVEIPQLDKTTKDKIGYKFTSDNTKKLVTIKSKLSHKNDAFFKAETRTDIYLRNSKNGAVKNMKVQLVPTFDVPQPASPRDTTAPFVYTNADGRATFVSLQPGKEYRVKYSWLGGKADGGNIKIADDGITTASLQFDETLIKAQ